MSQTKQRESQDEVVTKEEGMKGHTCECRMTCGNRHKQTNTPKTNDAPKKHMQGLRSNLRDNSSHLFGKNHSGTQGMIHALKLTVVQYFLLNMFSHVSIEKQT
jgi:hypothetical protein